MQILAWTSAALAIAAAWIVAATLLAWRGGGREPATWRWPGWLLQPWQQRRLREENAARFLGRHERRSLLSPKNTGLLLDGAKARLSDDDSFRNLAVIATTGAGKTASFILPNLLSLDGNSIVATDPSGTLYARTSGDLARRGYKVCRLDPLDLGESIGYNPLARAATNPEMQEIAHILIRTANQGSKAEPFWIA